MIQPPAYEAEFGQDNAGRPVLRVRAARKRLEPEVDTILLRLATSYYGKVAELSSYFEKLLRESHTDAAKILKVIGTSEAVEAIVKAHRGRNSTKDREDIEKVLFQLASDGNLPAREHLEELRYKWWWSVLREKKALRKRLRVFEKLGKRG